MEYIFEVWEAHFQHGQPALKQLFVYGARENAERIMANITARTPERILFIRPVLLSDVSR